MSDKLDGIDLNCDAVSDEAIDPSANETLMDNHINSGQVSGFSLDWSRVLGEVKDYAHGVSEGLGAEMEGLKNEIDLGNGENGSVGCEVRISSVGFGPGLKVDQIDNKADSLSVGGDKGKEVGEGPATRSGGVLPEGLRDEKDGTEGKITSEECNVMGVFVHAGNGTKITNDGFVSGLKVDQTENKAGTVFVVGEKGNEVAQVPETCSGDVLPEALRGETDGTGGKTKSEQSNVMGVFLHAGNGTTITNDGFVSRLKDDQNENKADRLFVGGEKENEVAQVPEMRSGDDLLENLRGETDGTEGKMKSEECNVMGVFVHAGNGTKINLVVDLNARHGAYEEILSGNRSDNKETEVKEVWGESNVPLLNGGVNNVVSGNKGVGLNENQDAVVKEQMTDIRLDYADGNDSKVIALRPKIRGEEFQTEKEGEYYLSDLVWGKVRSHRWWPGQIFEPSAASEKAINHFKKNSYLITYFGDQTFAWNEAAQLKPFRLHFTQMEKQSNAGAFCQAVDCALDEVSRRVEFGLSCSCLPEEQRAKIKSQTVVNVGIRAESSRRDGGDTISSAATFLPVEVLQQLKSLAVARHSEIGKLSRVTARAQLRAFNCWKGNYLLPEVVELDGLLEKGADMPASGEDEDSVEVMDDKVQGFRADGEVLSEIVKSAIRDSSSRKRKHGSGHDEGLKKKEKCVTDMVSGSGANVENGEKKLKRKRGRKKGSLSSDKKCIASEAVAGDSKLRKRKRPLSPRVQNESRLPEKFTKVGGRVHRAASQVGGTTSALESGQRSSKSAGGVDGQNLVDVSFGVSSRTSAKSQRKKLIPANMPPPEEMLSKLCLAASDPIEGYRSLYPFISLFSYFRNSICLQNTNARNHEKPTEEYKRGETSKSEIVETFQFEGMEDSYWTDRIIQSYPEEQVLFEPENIPEETTPVVEPGNVVNASPNLDNKQESCAGDVELEAENAAVLVDDNSEEYSPTTLTLKFSDLESVPSVTDLNKIFSRYGPLDEWQTKVFSKSKRANVFFKRRADAETAFSSAGKFSIFGPSLLGYSLKPTPRRASAASKRNGKGPKSAKGKLQYEA